LTASWLAHIEFNLNNFGAMAEAITELYSVLELADDEAMCRGALVLGDAHMHAGDRPQARRWYERARLAATNLGDHASIGALTYNSAALHVSLLRLSSIQGEAPPAEIALAKKEVESAINYQVAAGLSSLDHLLHSARVGVLVLSRQFSEASNLARDVLAHERIPADSAQQYLLKADMAIGLARLGQFDECRSLIAEIPLDHVDSFEPDDRAMILVSISVALESCIQSELAIDLRMRAVAALDQHRQNVKHLQSILQRLNGSTPQGVLAAS
jgi:tetratricopeptide (TPR) repeat protein